MNWHGVSVLLRAADYKNVSWSALPLYLAVCLVVSTLWAFQLPFEWGSDFGTYYAGAMYLDAEYRLYSDFFDHKGPIYYLFLKLIGLIVGYGAPQAVFSLAITAFIFFCSLIALVATKPKPVSIVVLLISTLVLAQQPTNASIALFLASQLLLTYYFTQKYLETGRVLHAVLASIFVTSATLTRVDAIAYVPWLFAIFLIHKPNIQKHNWKLVATGTTIGASAFASAIFVASVVLGMQISLHEAFVSNITFNTYYRGVIGGCYFCRGNHFDILVSCGALFTVGYIAMGIVRPFRALINFDGLFPRFYINPFSKIIYDFAAWTFGLIGVLVWIYSGSDKDYHVYLILVPILVLVISYGSEFLNVRFALAVCILFIPFGVDFARASKRLVLNLECLIAPFCEISPATAYRDAVQIISDTSLGIVIGGRGWPYVFAQQSPTISINDWWLYSNNTPFVTSDLQKQFEDILALPSGSEILIDSSLYHSDTGSPYLESIRINFEVASDLDYYLLLSKR